MIFPKEFFELNYRFAERVSEVTGQELGTALLSYTHLYMRFGLGRSFDPDNSLWQLYLAGLSGCNDPIAWTYEFYLQQTSQDDIPEESPFGCFSYGVWSDKRIRIHFHNADKAPNRPLSKERMDVRVGELRRMLAEIRDKVPEATKVVGGSWLYNLEAYRRLFPPKFLDTAYVGEDDVPFMANWGQFLGWDGKVKQDVADKFLHCLAQQNIAQHSLAPQSELAALLGCFPFPVLRLECEISAFFEHYQL